MIVQIIMILMIVLIILVSYIFFKKIKQNKEKLREEQTKIETMKKSLGVDKTIKSPRESLISLNKISKEFFKSYLKEKNYETTGELKEILAKKKETKMAAFCDELDYLLYSGKEIKKEDSLKMIEEFKEIIAAHKVK